MQMKKKKWFVAAALLMAFVLTMTGCASTVQEEQVEPQTVQVAALSGPTGMGMAQMITDKDSLDLGEGVTSEYTVATQADQVTGGIINGEYQIAAVPTNVAATLYNKTDGAVVLGAVNTLGTLSIVTNSDETVASIADLEGKTIYATGQGSTPEYVLEYLLRQNGLTPGENVTVEWLAEHSEAAAKLASGEGSIAMLPQPFATTAMAQNQDLKIAVDITQAWQDATGTQLPMGCIVVNKEWADNNQAVVQKFMEAYQTSVETINKADDTAAQYVVDAGIIPKAEVAKKAIPNCSITFISAQDAQEDLKAYYDVLASFEAQAVGGKVPDDAFYSLTY